MAQGQNNRNQQGNRRESGSQPRRVISLSSATEETVAGGARRALLQARVVSGRRPFDGEPMTLTTMGSSVASVQFGAFIEAASQLAHWSVEIPAGQERVYHVTDGDGNVSAPVTVKAKPIVLTAIASPRSTGGEYELVVSVKTVDGFGVPRVPVSVRCAGVVSDLLTDEKGLCTHHITMGDSHVDVVIESPGLKSWSTRLFSQKKSGTP